MRCRLFTLIQSLVINTLTVIDMVNGSNHSDHYSHLYVRTASAPLIWIGGPPQTPATLPGTLERREATSTWWKRWDPIVTSRTTPIAGHTVWHWSALFVDTLWRWTATKIGTRRQHQTCPCRTTITSTRLRRVPPISDDHHRPPAANDNTISTRQPTRPTTIKIQSTPAVRPTVSTPKDICQQRLATSTKPGELDALIIRFSFIYCSPLWCVYTLG